MLTARASSTGLGGRRGTRPTLLRARLDSHRLSAQIPVHPSNAPDLTRFRDLRRPVGPAHARADRGRGPEERADLPRRGRGLRRADQAAGDRAAAAHHGPGDVLRRAGRAAAGAGRRHRRRRHLLGRLGVGLQLRLRPRHRRADAAHPAPGAAAPPGLARGPRWSSASCSPCSRPWCWLLWVNPLSAALALAANAFYVFGYTMLLKRRTTQNIVWGGLAGCFPALIGWTAVTGALSWVPVVLFAVVFFWTPPHTWALALRYREDYANVDVPMLPVVAPAREVGRQVVVYSWVMVAVSLLLWPVAGTGLGLPRRRRPCSAPAFLVEAHRMWGRAARHRGPQPRSSRCGSSTPPTSTCRCSSSRSRSTRCSTPLTRSPPAQAPLAGRGYWPARLTPDWGVCAAGGGPARGELGGQRRWPAGRGRSRATEAGVAPPERPREPRISVVVPALNEAAQPARGAAGSCPPVHEVILVDGGSVDDTVEAAREVLPGHHHGHPDRAPARATPWRPASPGSPATWW